MQVHRLDSCSFAFWRKQIAELLDESVVISFPDFPVEEDYGERKCHEVSTYLEDGKAVVFVVADGDRLAGWIWCHGINRMGRHRLHISELAVSNDYRRQGVASCLITSAEEYAKCSGCQEVDLLVTVENTAATSFYQNAGYEPERILMRRTLT